MRDFGEKRQKYVLPNDKSVETEIEISLANTESPEKKLHAKFFPRRVHHRRCENMRRTFYFILIKS